MSVNRSRAGLPSFSKSNDVSRKVVRKVIRSQAAEFHYERDVQPQPKIGPWATPCNFSAGSDSGPEGRAAKAICGGGRLRASVDARIVRSSRKAQDAPRARSAERRDAGTANVGGSQHYFRRHGPQNLAVSALQRV
jgi:hypothetical protein